MLKRWHESRPFTFEAIFIFLYMTIPILDAIFITPKMVPVCSGTITDDQVRQCTNWIKKKEKLHVPKTSKSLGRLYRDTPSDKQFEWNREIGTFGKIPSQDKYEGR